MVEEALNRRGTSRGEGAADCAGKFNAQVLDYYRENGPRPFNSIYDTPEIIAERKKRGKG